MYTYLESRFKNIGNGHNLAFEFPAYVILWHVKNCINSLNVLVFLVLLIAFPNASIAQNSSQIGADAFAQAPNISNPVMSANGEFIAFGTLDEKGEEIVKIFNLETSAVTVYNLEKDFVGDNWIGDTKKSPTKLWGLYFDATSQLYVSLYKTLTWDAKKVSDDKINLNRTVLLDLKKRTSIEYMGSAFPSEFEYRTNVSDHYYVMEKLNESNSLMKTDPKSHNYKIIGDGKTFTLDWLLDDKANPVARLDFDPGHKFTKVFAKNDKDWVEVLHKNNYPLVAFELIGLSTSGKPVVRQTSDNELNEYSVINVETMEVKPFIKTDTLEIDTYYKNVWDGHVVGIKMGGISPYWLYFDNDFKSAIEKLEKKFPERLVSIVANNSAKNRFIFKVESDVSPPLFYVYFAQSERLISLGSLYPKLATQSGASIFSEEVAISDKTVIPTYLTVSQQYADIANLPTIVFPHSFTEDREAPVFEPMAQFFASRGYLVIQPQYRGSDGFGEKYRLAGVGQLGELSVNDLIDVTKWAIKSGYSDPNRICIVGTNIGGYVALQAMIKAPDLFKCGIAYSPITDIADQVGYINARFGFDSKSANYWRNFFDYYNTAKMQSLSPRRNADRLKAPVLIMHGTDNTSVDIIQSLEFVKELKKLNKPHEYFDIEKGDLTLLRPDAKQKFFNLSEKFLADKIGAQNRQ